MNYGNQLKYWREQNKLSQTDLAKKTGLTQANISRWEDNKRTPSIENCVTLADFYKITLDDLIGRDTQKNWI